MSETATVEVPLDPLPAGKALVAFGARWVAPWRPLQALMGTLRSEGTNVVEVDCDEFPEIADRYAVVSLPTFVLLEDGREKRRRLGAVSETDVRSMLS